MTRLRLTRSAWTWLLLGTLGSAAVWWFCWALQATSLFTGTPPPRGAASPALAASVVTAAWAVLWAAIGLIMLRERGRWVVTRAQETRLAAEQAEAAARSATWHEARRQEALQQEVTDTMARMTRLHELERAFGDAGIAAFMLGVPVEDVLRIAGQDEHPPASDPGQEQP